MSASKSKRMITLACRSILIYALYTCMLFPMNLYAQKIPAKNTQQEQLQQLLRPLSNIQSIKLGFHETRHSLFLKQAKQSTGVIEYIQPDTFIKEVFSPIQQKFIFKDNQLLIYKDKQLSRRLSLNDYPQIKQFKTLFIGLMQADGQQLSQHYQYNIKILGTDKTQLNLKAKNIDQFIETDISITQQKIEILFVQQQIKRVSITTFSGEHSEMTFTTIRIKRNKAESL